MNPVRWTRLPDGSVMAETMIAGCRVAGVASAEEFAAEAAAEVGLKFPNFKSLGRAIKSVVSPTAVLRLAGNASAILDAFPQAKQAIASSPEGQAVLAGLGGAKVLAKARAGDPRAQDLVRRAERAASDPAAASWPAPTTPQGQVLRWLVTLERR